MSDLEDFMDFADYVRRHREVGLRRYLRDYSDPFTKYSNREFHARYRFTPETIKNVILPLVSSELDKPTRRGLPFHPEIMLLVTLRYYATGSFQVGIDTIIYEKITFESVSILYVLFSKDGCMHITISRNS